MIGHLGGGDNLRIEHTKFVRKAPDKQNFLIGSFFLFLQLFGLGIIHVSTFLFIVEYLFMAYSLILFCNYIIVNLIKINPCKYRIYIFTISNRLQFSY